MSLREQIKADLTLFINTDDFAETHTINGKSMDIVLDNDLYQDTMAKGRGLDSPDGDCVAEISFFVIASVYGKRPGRYDPVTFDGKNYLVLDAQQDAGLYYITLGRG